MKRAGEPTRSGVEWYEQGFEFDPMDEEIIFQLTPAGMPIPHLVTLVWVRRHPEGWQRVVAGPRASRIIGYPKGATGDREFTVRSREIFDREHGALKAWARLLPGLSTAVSDAERNLPD